MVMGFLMTFLAGFLRWVINRFPDCLLLILNQESLSELSDRGLIIWSSEEEDYE